MGGAGGIPGPPGVGDRTEGGRALGMDTSSHSVKKIPLETATGPPSTSKDIAVIAGIQLTTEHGLGSGGSTRSAAPPAQPVAQLRQQLQAILSGPVGAVDGMLKLVELQDQSGRAPGERATRGCRWRDGAARRPGAGGEHVLGASGARIDCGRRHPRRLLRRRGGAARGCSQPGRTQAAARAAAARFSNGQ